eukprot:284817824_6
MRRVFRGLSTKFFKRIVHNLLCFWSWWPQERCHNLGCLTVTYRGVQVANWREGITLGVGYWLTNNRVKKKSIKFIVRPTTAILRLHGVKAHMTLGYFCTSLLGKDLRATHPIFRYTDRNKLVIALVIVQGCLTSNLQICSPYRQRGCICRGWRLPPYKIECRMIGPYSLDRDFLHYPISIPSYNFQTLLFERLYPMHLSTHCRLQHPLLAQEHQIPNAIVCIPSGHIVVIFHQLLRFQTLGSPRDRVGSILRACHSEFPQPFWTAYSIILSNIV